MRVILDTNVLLGALISPHGPPDAIYRAWRAARFELVTSAAQLDELRRVSRYPKLKTILPAHRVGTMVNNMHRAIVSLMEELEAVDWYNQRADACTDPELKAVLEHNRDEEIEHASMTLEWIRRNNRVFDKELREFLFTDQPLSKAADHEH